MFRLDISSDVNLLACPESSIMQHVVKAIEPESLIESTDLKQMLDTPRSGRVEGSYFTVRDSGESQREIRRSPMANIGRRNRLGSFHKLGNNCGYPLVLL